MRGVHARSRGCLSVARCPIANPIPSHVPDRVRSLLVVPLADIPEAMQGFSKVLVLDERIMRTATVARITDGVVHFKVSPVLRGVAELAVTPRPIEAVWVDMRTEDGRSLLVAALLPLLTPNHRKVRHYAWKRQDTPGTRAPAWVAVGALHDQWIGPPGAGDVDHQVPALTGDMGLTEALLHVWAWAQGRGA